MKQLTDNGVRVLPDKTAYFPLDDKKIEEFSICRPYLEGYVHVIRNKIYIKFQWNLIVLFATKTQLETYDKVRKYYVQAIILKHCKKQANCYSKFVGSNTPKSDIDVNISCPIVEKVIHDIHEDHAQHFNDTLDVMFDTNLYGSVFRYFQKECYHATNVPNLCYPKHKSNYDQRVWSFLRIAETLNKESSLTLKNIVAVMKPEYKHLFNKATTLLHKMQKKKDRQHWYKVYLRAYMKALRDKRYSPHKISEAYSLCKFFEYDAYYTVGAVLHIVEQRNEIEPNSLYDSIYDNLGFAINSMFSYGICHSTFTMIKVSKMCKYIARICDAYRILTNTTVLDNLYKLSEKINRMRKQSNLQKTKLIHEIDRLFEMMNVQSDNANDIVVAVVRFVFNILPPDPLLK